MAGTVNDFKISPVNAVVKIEILTSGNLGNERKTTVQFIKKERTVTSQSFLRILTVHVGHVVHVTNRN